MEQPHPGMSQPQAQGGASKESLWYLDNYILLKDYYDRTISRIAARCVRMGNIAMEEYPFYGYILDVLEEISDTGDYILQHKELYGKENCRRPERIEKDAERISGRTAQQFIPGDD